MTTNKRAVTAGVLVAAALGGFAGYEYCQSEKIDHHIKPHNISLKVGKHGSHIIIRVETKSKETKQDNNKQQNSDQQTNQSAQNTQQNQQPQQEQNNSDNSRITTKISKINRTTDLHRHL